MGKAPEHETHSDQLRRHLGELTTDAMLLEPGYIIRHLLRISERLDRLENPMVRKPFTEWPLQGDRNADR